MIGIAAGATVLAALAAVLVAARMPRTRRAFRLFDPANPERATADPHYLWSEDGAGTFVRTSRTTGAVAGRYVETDPGEATLAAEWSSERRSGIRFAPRLAGRELFRIDRGRSEWGIKTLYLKPVEEAVPVFGSTPTLEKVNL